MLFGAELMPPIKEPVLIGDWLADPRDDSLSRGTERVKLEPRTMRLLMRLAQAPGIVVSQDELLESVWTGLVVGPASVYQSMSQLRKMLGDVEEPARYIETVARKGYRLVASVSAAPVTGPAMVRAPMVSVPAVSGESALVEEPGSQQSFWTMLAGAAALVVMAAAWRVAPPLDLIPDLPSIVVLPFTDMTPGKTEQVFCDGLTEEMSNWLAQVPTLRVVARTSAFSYRDTKKDVRTIGEELKISHVLEGSLRRSGNRLRITVQLIHAPSQFHLWSHSYDVEVGNLINVQEDVARQVVGNLEIRMTPETDSRFAGRRAASAEAQNYYLLAKSHAQHLEAASNERAIDLFRKSLSADPSFALAKVWLAFAISNRRYFTNQPIEELMPEIEPLLADVERTGTQLVDFYVVRGSIRTELRQREAALADLQHALELNANSLEAAAALGFYHLTMGEPRDAVGYYTTASAVDPAGYAYYIYRCIAHMQMGQHSTAQTLCARGRSLKPESPWTYSATSDLAASRGDIAEALKWSNAALEHGGDIAENQSSRANWLFILELMQEAGEAYRRSMSSNPDGTRQNPLLTLVGAAAAIDTAGAPGLRSFIDANGLAASTNARVLMQLANAALMAGDTVLANEFVDRALTSGSLQAEDIASPWDAIQGQSYLLVIASALRARGDLVTANQRLDELAALLDHLRQSGVETFGYHELAAQLAAMQGRDDAAMASLQRAVQLGWRAAWLAEHQPFFASLRTRPDYRELIASVRARNAELATTLGRWIDHEAGNLRRPTGATAASRAEVVSLEHQVDGASDFVAAIDRGKSIPGLRDIRWFIGPAEGREKTRNDVLGGSGCAGYRHGHGPVFTTQEQHAGCGGQIVERLLGRCHGRPRPRGPAAGEELRTQAGDEIGIGQQVGFRGVAGLDRVDGFAFLVV